MGERRPGQGRVSGERSERNLDPVEHAHTLLWRSELFVVAFERISERAVVAGERGFGAGEHRSAA
jgi:hypothetical protein